MYIGIVLGSPTCLTGIIYFFVFTLFFVHFFVQQFFVQKDVKKHFVRKNVQKNRCTTKIYKKTFLYKKDIKKRIVISFLKFQIDIIDFNDFCLICIYLLILNNCNSYFTDFHALLLIYAKLCTLCFSHKPDWGMELLGCQTNLRQPKAKPWPLALVDTNLPL